MAGLIGPLGLLIATLLAIAKASRGSSTPESAAGGNEHRTGGTASTGSATSETSTRR